MRFYRALSFILIMVLFTTGNSFASNLNSQKASIDTKIKNAQVELKQTQKEKASIKEQINKLEDDIEKVSDELDNLDNELALEQARLKEAEKRLAEANSAKEAQKQSLLKRMRYMYETPKTTYLELILKSKDINTMYNRAYYINQIMESDNKLIKRLADNVVEIETSKKEIERAKLAVQLLKTEQLNKKHAIEQTKVKKGAILVSLTAEEKKILEDLETLEEQSKKIEKQIQAQTKGSTKVYVGGKFTWPSPGYTRITSSFGYRIHPVSKEKKLHTGVDIGVPSNSKVVAAADGTVLTAGYISGYGYTVIIDHGSGITTLYGHNNSLLVKKGQEVKKGQQISKSGSTGISTGPHLHFEVRKNGTPVDPMSYFN